MVLGVSKMLLMSISSLCVPIFLLSLGLFIFLRVWGDFSLPFMVDGVNKFFEKGSLYGFMFSNEFGCG